MHKPLSSLVHDVLDPVLARKAGTSLALLDAWPQIAGPRLADCTCPLRIDWPKRPQGDETFRPGTIVIAADALGALHVQHEKGQILQRINSFLGYEAVSGLRIVQRPVGDKPVRRRKRPPTPEQVTRADELAEGFEDEGLREAVRRFARNVLAERGRR